MKNNETIEVNETTKKKIKKAPMIATCALLALCGIGIGVYAGSIDNNVDSKGFAEYTVDGSSMEPTLHDGDTIKVDTKDKDPERFDIIVCNFNDDLYVKRVIGLPNEKMEYKDNQLYINGKLVEDPYIGDYTMHDMSITLGKDDIYVIGDDRMYSADSRKFGRFKLGYIIGTVEQ